MRFSLKLIGLVLISSLLIASLGTNKLVAEELSPVVPSIASFILPGSGQLLNDEPNKALTHFVVIVGIDTATYMFARTTRPFNWTSYRLGTALHLAWSGYSAYDAYQVASGRQQRGIFNSSLELDSKRTTGSDIELSSPALTITGIDREFSVSKVD